MLHALPLIPPHVDGRGHSGQQFGLKLTKRRHRYEAVRPIPIREGPIAPAMGQPGGGTQYYFTHSIVDLVNAGYLREDPL
jgi:hypothetical protein